MKKVLFITVMLLSIAGFCATSESLAQPLPKQVKRTKHDRTVKGNTEQGCLSKKPVEQTHLKQAVEQPPVNIKCQVKEKSNPSGDSGNEQQLIAEFQQIIMLLNNNLPNWDKNGQLKSRRRAIINAFVASLGESLQYSLDSYKAPKVNSEFKPLPLLWMQKNRIAYLRIDGFNSEVLFQFRQLHDILMANYRLIGMIIDLRNCRSFDYKNGIACLTQLTNAYQSKSPVKIHLAILMGADTLGVGEYFIHQLRKRVRPVIIGVKSAGQPFEYQSEKLIGGGYLLLPSMPKNIDNKVNVTAQIPTIKIINSPQRAYKFQDKNPDIMVKYASELLIAINATSGIALNLKNSLEKE
jgi:hypothetical protein